MSSVFSQLAELCPRIAVVGASGAVGREMLAVLEQHDFPADKLRLLASKRSAGQKLSYAGTELVIEELTKDSFKDIDFALFSAGASVSKEYKDAVIKSGCIMIDNSSAFRMDPQVPLVVPEVNPHALDKHQGLIANPNCSTIQMVVALKPLYDLARIKRVVVSTYQAASGAGAAAMDELYDQTQDYLSGRQEELKIEAFAHQIAFNCIPQIDVFMEDASTKEEWKMVVETKKILEDEDLQVAANCVRVPVLRCHSECINLEFEQELSLEAARAAFEKAPGICLMDDPEQKLYPMPALLAGSDPVYVGRLRKDNSVEHGLAFWNVSDQLRKGAALNAVQIAELCIARQHKSS